jgi:hypothetical protein
MNGAPDVLMCVGAEEGHVGRDDRVGRNGSTTLP